jgi:hypothetical protein
MKLTKCYLRNPSALSCALSKHMAEFSLHGHVFTGDVCNNVVSSSDYTASNLGRLENNELQII